MYIPTGFMNKQSSSRTYDLFLQRQLCNLLYIHLNRKTPVTFMSGMGWWKMHRIPIVSYQALDAI